MAAFTKNLLPMMWEVLEGGPAAPVSARIPEYLSVVLVSKGAPVEYGRLNTIWEKDTAEPEVNGFPHFTNAKGSLHLFRTLEGLWEIAPELDAGTGAFAVARTSACHPNTIKPGEWKLPEAGGWAAAEGFMVTTEGPNTEDVRERAEACLLNPLASIA